MKLGFAVMLPQKGTGDRGANEWNVSGSFHGALNIKGDQGFVLKFSLPAFLTEHSMNHPFADAGISEEDGDGRC